MDKKKIGKQTIKFSSPPVIIASAAQVGPKEGEGPLRDYFDYISDDNYFGQSSWEKGEQVLLENTVRTAIKKANLTTKDVDYFLAGDLLNQTISANYTARQLEIPFLGLYGACSTMYEGLAVGSILIDGGYGEKVVAATSSHYCTAERQYRFPVEQGVQRSLSAQWTVTGSGAVVLASEGNGPRVTYATIGKVVDLGIKDANDMGSAMAPAAVDTLLAHFEDTGRSPDYYDLIITGDLATIGNGVAKEFAKQKGLDLGEKFTDCGILIFDKSQDVHSGGSGCGCAASVTAGFLLTEMRKGRYKKILGIGTGALLSTCATQQGESIPGIGHAVALEM